MSEPSYPNIFGGKKMNFDISSIGASKESNSSI